MLSCSTARWRVSVAPSSAVHCRRRSLRSRPDEAARKALREQRREEVETAWKDRVADLKEKHETFVAGVKEKVSGFFHGDAK